MQARLRVWATTDVGKQRKHNEDSLLCDDELRLYVVADGMGGHAAGEVASRRAVETVRQVIQDNRQTLVDFATGTGQVGRTDLIRLLESSVQLACSVVHGEGQRDESKRGMGTTLDALLLVGSRGFIAHVGDSRVYLHRQGSSHQLTEDHSLINELLRRGRLTREQIEKVNYKNAVTRAVGVYESVEVDVIDFDVLAGDRFLLCTDGLHGYLEDNEVPSLLTELDGQEDVSQELVDLANERGGSDNITAVVVSVPESETGVDRLATEVNLKLETLHRMQLFRHLTYKELVRLLNYTDVRDVASGENMFQEGAEGEEFYVILKGRVRIHSGSTPLNDLDAGECFGELALVDRSPRAASASVIEDGQLLVFKRRNFFDLVRRDHDVAVKLLWSFLTVMTDRARTAYRDLDLLREHIFFEGATSKYESQKHGPS